jgi:F0F1-type ATP synthase delta subunit
VIISSPLEVGRLINELTGLDEALMQLELRGAGQNVKMPTTTRLLDKLAEANKLNLLQPGERALLLKFLNLIHAQAPVLKISFSVDPAPAFMERLITWLRREIHPQILVTVGLQPNLGAGCLVYGNSKVFDFSLKQTFIKQRPLLLKRLTASAEAA